MLVESIVCKFRDGLKQRRTDFEQLAKLKIGMDRIYVLMSSLQRHTTRSDLARRTSHCRDDGIKPAQVREIFVD